MSLGFRRLRAWGLSLGLRLGAVDLRSGRAYELKVLKAQSLGSKFGFKVRSGRFKVRAGL